ncbi:NAD(P)/FAD-dependent oxidoreductase [Aliifodinibius sp. S!AR15-10]|uniref:NAD(P)/FAD-dependent oxidoreductase n=1 Tax=Aliifodinibius sp. S!AR15-10 TaxID=2950437 RepID=UPI00285F6327|nr:NAD(P)/FAD-dependent oxidoreductase [Aliifodinibius sp. S!AR15-10]MDR8394376.1 NAD(P)/FAD-dependent oxidoreductase [Aliifodinibius sp. S!AR15-10]
MSDQKHAIIIGGGFGGISAAKELRNSGIKVTIIDKNNHHLFQPLLYQVATAALSPGDIAVPIRAIFGKSSNVRVVLGEVTEINKQEKSLKLKDERTFDFDYLVVAAGAQYNYFGNDDWAESAPGLKSISDALQVRERILLSLEEAEQIDDPKLREPYLTYVIIGGGPTGVEMAGAIAEIAKRNMMRDYKNFSKNESRIFLVEAGPQILNGFPKSLAEKARESLEDMGVSVLLDTPVTEISDSRVQFKQGAIETPNIIWAAGVAASPLMSSLDEPQDRTGRVIVNKDLSISDYPDIFVIGDAAHLEEEDGNPLPGLAPVAMQEGRYVGKIIRNNTPSKDRKPFHYVDKGTMATIGRAKAVADVKGMKFSGFIAWILWSVIHIFYLIGFRNRIKVFVEWMWYYFSFKRGVRLITNRFSK